MKEIIWTPWKACLVCAASGIIAGAMVMYAWDHRNAPAPTPPSPAAEISLPVSITTDVGRPVLLEAATVGKIVKFHAWERVGLVQAGDKKAWVHSDKAGVYKVWAYTSVGNLPTDMVFTTVTVGTVPPGPTPPVPPGPDPVPPVPPGPTPPGPLVGLKVLILEESKSRTPAITAIIFSKALYTYLDSKCGLESDGKTKTYTIQDKDTDLGKYFAGWKELAAKAKKTSIPWLIVADKSNKIAWEGPLPESVEAVIAAIKPYAEGK